VAGSSCLSVVSSHFKPVLASLRVLGSGSLLFKSFYMKSVYVLDLILILVHYGCRYTREVSVQSVARFSVIRVFGSTVSCEW